MNESISKNNCKGGFKTRPYHSISQTTKSLLEKYHLRLKKSLGQNLLVDPACLNRIIETANISKEDIVVEIGTGSGILTKEISKKAKKVISFEIDKRIFEVAKEYLFGIDNIDLRNEDFLKATLTPFSPLPVKGEGLGERVKIVANIPYYITTPIIEKIIEINRDQPQQGNVISSVILTVQREFAERMAAKPGTKQYGSFTIFVNYYFEPEIIFYIPKSAFIPQPEVGSAVISLKPRTKSPVEVKDEKIFFETVRAAFNQRRKTLRNALSAKFEKEKVDATLSAAGIDCKRRGETLSIQEFAKITNKFYTISQQDYLKDIYNSASPVIG
ncbi:MAG: 16S rRNA (adenine(1518)-N(6)/adenine(1519)-N(6))-dimethyltransferase RsmA [Candidatus Margulisiibacteriota bacterium]